MKNTILLFSIIFLNTACGYTFKKNINKIENQNKKPNIILFLVDDLGWTDPEIFGSDLHQTPFINQLAKEGISFSNAYSASSVCSPSRASIMTGKYPARLHCTDWIKGHQKPFAKMKIPDWTMYLEPKEYTLAEAFKDAGYITAHIGKWHLGEEEKYWPLSQGFDINIAGWSAGSPKANGGGGYFSPYKNPNIQDGPKGEYLTERLAKEAQKFIKENVGQPFFLNYWLYNVHTPLQAAASKTDKYKKLVENGKHHSNPIYAAMVEHMDDALGSIVNELNELGIAENTILVFYSDNGGLKGNFENGKQKVTDNYPLRSGKGDMYEGGVRVPLIISWPEKLQHGRIINNPFISPDLYPTLLSLAGIEIKNNRIIDGRDFADLLLDKSDSIYSERIFWHYPHYHLEGAKPYSAIRQGDWKLIEVFEYDSLMLFNLKEDIGEIHNLASQYPEKVVSLYSALKKWREKTGAQMPTTNPGYDPNKENEWKFSRSATLSKRAVQKE